MAEILSPSQTLSQLREKAETWLEYGVREVWILDPAERIVEVRRTGGPAFTVHERDTLTGREALAGFMVRVADLFPA